MVTTLVPAVAVNRLFSLALSYLGVRMVTIEAQALFVNKLLHQAITAHIKTQTSPGPYQQQLPIQQQQLQNQTPSLATNPAGYPQQQQPQQQPQLQQGQPLYNPIQVVACLNHVLVDSIVKAGTSPNWTLHNNSKGVAPELNQTFIQNATQTLDSCIVPISR